MANDDHDDDGDDDDDVRTSLYTCICGVRIILIGRH